MNTIIIGVADRTDSGKSTFANKLKVSFQDDVAVLYHDNYYKAQDGLEFKGWRKVNCDHPDAPEAELLLEQPTQLKEGKAIECLVYDYIQHNRPKDVAVVGPKRVILLERVLALTDPKLRDLLDTKTFVGADAGERILRRVIRDVKEQRRDIEGTVGQHLTTVKSMHYLYVELARPMTGIVVNNDIDEVAF